MDDFLRLGGFIAIWALLQYVVLPRMGVPT
jgi:hypothetical protein